MQSPVFCAVDVSKHALGSYHMLIAPIMSLPAENWEGGGYTAPIGSHHVNMASDL
jgi:hypothetical protein